MQVNPSSVKAESIRVLRTHFVTQHQTLGRRALALCAPAKGAGCTFVAANLAVALAQVGLRTVLIDADINAGGADFPIKFDPSTRGLSDFLRSGDMTISQLTQPAGIENLFVIPCGAPPTRAEELLGKDQFRTLVMTCMRDFDITLIDTPPAGQYADVRRIASIAGYAAIVARKDQTLFKEVKTLTKELTLDRVEVIGAVFNES
jgi:capsular exopolysaccharide synthesis family protein